MQDSSGPYDYHLSRHLLHLCQREQIPVRRDLFRYYHSDAESAVRAGNDTRVALIAFGTDATHGYERTHRDRDRKSTRLNSSHVRISYAVFCLKKKKKKKEHRSSPHV